MKGINAGARLLLRFFTICLLVGWMGVIFLFSDQPAEESGRTSGGAAQFICRTVQRVCHTDWTEEELLENAELIDYPVRKLAHMTEYGILGTLTFLAIIAWPISGKKLYGIPLAFSFVYACTDEVHQYFVEGRACRFTDVLWDTAGAILALVLVGLIYRKVRKIR